MQDTNQRPPVLRITVLFLVMLAIIFGVAMTYNTSHATTYAHPCESATSGRPGAQAQCEAQIKRTQDHTRAAEGAVEEVFCRSEREHGYSAAGC